MAKIDPGKYQNSGAINPQPGGKVDAATIRRMVDGITARLGKPKWPAADPLAEPGDDPPTNIGNFTGWTALALCTGNRLHHWIR
jgi:hypothetical protein